MFPDSRQKCLSFILSWSIKLHDGETKCSRNIFQSTATVQKIFTPAPLNHETYVIVPVFRQCFFPGSCHWDVRLSPFYFLAISISVTQTGTVLFLKLGLFSHQSGCSSPFNVGMGSIKSSWWPGEWNRCCRDSSPSCEEQLEIKHEAGPRIRGGIQLKKARYRGRFFRGKGPTSCTRSSPGHRPSLPSLQFAALCLHSPWQILKV